MLTLVDIWRVDYISSGICPSKRLQAPALSAITKRVLARCAKRVTSSPALADSEIGFHDGSQFWSITADIACLTPLNLLPAANFLFFAATAGKIAVRELDVSYQEVVHSDRTEETGVPSFSTHRRVRMNIHKNARLTALRREEMALSVIEGRFSKAQAARTFAVSPKL